MRKLQRLRILFVLIALFVINTLVLWYKQHNRESSIHHSLHTHHHYHHSSDHHSSDHHLVEEERSLDTTTATDTTADTTAAAAIDTPAPFLVSMCEGSKGSFTARILDDDDSQGNKKKLMLGEELVQCLRSTQGKSSLEAANVFRDPHVSIFHSSTGGSSADTQPIPLWPMVTRETHRKICAARECQTKNLMNALCLVCDPELKDSIGSIGRENTHRWMPRDPSSEPYVKNDWCNAEDAKILILRAPDVFVDFASVHSAVAWTLFSDRGVYSDHSGHMEYEDQQVVIMDKLAAIGRTRYPDAAGHYPNEIMPRLLFLDEHLPLDIPILFYDTPIHNKVMKELREAGMLRKERQWMAHPEKKVILVRDLMFMHSPQAEQFICHNALFRLAQRTLHSALKNTGRGEIPAKERILIIDRKDAGSRRMQRSTELRSALHEKFGEKLNVEIVQLNGRGFLEIAKIFYDSRVIITPHGAALANLSAIRPGTVIIEVMYADGSVPREYYCQARAVGGRYYAHVEKGSYGGSVDIRVDELVDIVDKEISN